MGTGKATAYVVLMFALSAAQDNHTQAALRDLPLPWVVATLHFGAGLLWIFPAWAVGLRQTPCLNDIQKKRVAPVAFLHAAGYVCSLGVLGAGSLVASHGFQGLEPAAVSFMSWLGAEKAEHFVAKLALVPLMVGVAITFREGFLRSTEACLGGLCMSLLCGARTAFSSKVMTDDAVAFKGQMCSVIFVSGCLVLLPFAVVMEGAQVVGLWERAAANVGSSVLIIRLVKGGTLFYMWSECLFGLLEQTGPAVVALVIAVRPVAVYAFCAAFLGTGWTTAGGVGTVLTLLGAAMFYVSKHKYTLKPQRTKQ